MGQSGRRDFMVDPDDFRCICQDETAPAFIRPVHDWGDPAAGCEHVEEAAAYRREWQVWRAG